MSSTATEVAYVVALTYEVGYNRAPAHLHPDEDPLRARLLLVSEETLKFASRMHPTQFRKSCCSQEFQNSDRCRQCGNFVYKEYRWSTLRKLHGLYFNDISTPTTARQNSLEDSKGSCGWEKWLKEICAAEPSGGPVKATARRGGVAVAERLREVGRMVFGADFDAESSMSAAELQRKLRSCPTCESARRDRTTRKMMRPPPGSLGRTISFVADRLLMSDPLKPLRMPKLAMPL